MSDLLPEVDQHGCVRIGAYEASISDTHLWIRNLYQDGNRVKIPRDSLAMDWLPGAIVALQLWADEQERAA